MPKFRAAVLAVYILITAAAANAQGLIEVKRMWRTQQYSAVLRPLLDLRDLQPSFEIDYMLGTALCKVPAFSSDGYDYLSALLTAYLPPFLFDGRPVDIRDTQRKYCPSPGVTESIRPSPDVRSREIQAHRPLSTAAIAKTVRSKLAAAALPREMLGTYSMVHDGWRGTLVLNDAGGAYTDSNGKSFPVHIASVSGNHVVFYVVGLGGENADGSGGQKFDGYWMTQTRDALAGTTVWQGTTFGFYAVKR